MASVNKVIIVGNLGRDPEIRYMPSGDAIANIAVATSYKSKDKNTGEQKELTEWHRISFFGRLAEIVGQYLKKVRRSTSKDGCRPVNTPTRTASRSTQPKSLPRTCRCWAVARAWAVAVTTWTRAAATKTAPRAVHSSKRHARPRPRRPPVRSRSRRRTSRIWTTTSRSNRA